MRLLAAIALACTLASPALADGLITIEGRGEVSAAPDTAYVTSGVTSQGATAREALDANSAAMAELIETLKAAGIESRDIQTSGFSVNPNYVYTDQRDANGYTLPPRINGYVVTNSVSVRVRELPALGRVLDQAVTVGANTINGVTFAVADPTALLDDARRKAFADARRKAELYATAAGESLDDLVSVTEAQTYGQPQPMMMRQSADMAASPVPVETGELTFEIAVTVAWSLDD